MVTHMALETEIKYFEAHRTEWLKHHADKFALIRGDALAGVFDSNESAYAAGVGQWGNVAFLVKQILPEDLIEQSPAFVYGLLNANP